MPLRTQPPTGRHLCDSLQVPRTQEDEMTMIAVSPIPELSPSSGTLTQEDLGSGGFRESGAQ